MKIYKMGWKYTNIQKLSQVISSILLPYIDFNTSFKNFLLRI